MLSPREKEILLNISKELQKYESTISSEVCDGNHEFILIDNLVNNGYIEAENDRRYINAHKSIYRITDKGKNAIR